MCGFSILGRFEIALREALWFRNGTVVCGTGLSGVMEMAYRGGLVSLYSLLIAFVL